MRKLQAIIDKAAIFISCILMSLMMIVLTYNVFARFLGNGITWYMEFSQYSNIWAVLFAGIAVCAGGQHLRINALDAVFKGKSILILRALVAAAMIAFYVLFGYASVILTQKSKQVISTMAPLKMAYVYWIVPVCAFISAAATALQLAIEITDVLKGGADA